MRVITGKYKGRKLVVPQNLARPTLDRMKETLFNIINPMLEGAVILDLFAGSGQLAIESLSRGASRAVLCDNNRDSQKAIKENFEKIGIGDPELFCGDFRDCLRRVNGSFDIIFVDPPYKSNYYTETLNIISEQELLSDMGIIVCEYSATDRLPQNVGQLVRYDSRRIGTVAFDFYKRG